MISSVGSGYVRAPGLDRLYQVFIDCTGFGLVVDAMTTREECWTWCGAANYCVWGTTCIHGHTTLCYKFDNLDCTASNSGSCEFEAW